MPRGINISEITFLIQLVWTTFDGAKWACGEQSDLAQEVSKVYSILLDLQFEASNERSSVCLAEESRRIELGHNIKHCGRHLRRLNCIITRFNELSYDERGGNQLWEKFRFGSGTVRRVADIRTKILTYSMAISLSLELISIGSQGHVERKLARKGGDLKGIQESINLLISKLRVSSRNGSIMAACLNNDREFWRSFHHELVKDGYSRRTIHKHRDLIEDYVRELNARGVLDDDRAGQSEISFDTHTNAEEEFYLVPEPEESGYSELPTLDVLIRNGQTQFYELPGYSSQTPVEEHPELQRMTVEPIVSPAPVSVDEVEASAEFVCIQPDSPCPSFKTVASQDRTSWNTVEESRHSTPEDGYELSHIVREELVRRLPQNQEPETHQRVLSSSSSYNSTSSTIKNLDSISLVPDNTEPIKKSISEETLIPLPTPLFEKDFVMEEVEEIPGPPAYEKQQKPITFQDALGRKYNFPFHKAATWTGMEKLIRKAFLHVDVTGKSPVAFHYELLSPNGEVILPQSWESMIEPDMAITMNMWVIPEPPKRSKLGQSHGHRGSKKSSWKNSGRW